MINQNLKILHTASFFLSELTVSALLIILQPLALYQLLLHKKSIFTRLLWLASHFTENLEQIHTHIPYFYFAFSVLWSSPVEQLIKNEVLMTTSYHLLQWLSQYTLKELGHHINSKCTIYITIQVTAPTIL